MAADGSRLRPAVDLLLASIRAEGHASEPHEPLDLTETEWREVTAAAAYHNVRPLLYHMMARPDRRTAVPEAIFLELSAACRAIALRNLQWLGELAETVRMLDAASVPVVVLKGAHLCTEVYRNPALREMQDIDILVPKSSLDEAVTLIRDRGYASRSTSAGLAEQSKHAPRLEANGRAPIEVHWSLTGPHEPYAVPPDEFWSRSVSITIAGTPMRGLSTEDLLLHLCLHTSYQHQFELGLRPMADIAALLDVRRDVDWNAVASRAHTYGWRRGVHVTLALARELARAPVPSSVFHRLAADGPPEEWAMEIARAETLTFDAKSRAIRGGIAPLARDTTMAAKARHVWKRVVLSPADARRVYGGITGLMRLRALLLRPFTLLRRYARPAAGVVLRRGDWQSVAHRKDRLRRWLAGAR